jgi:hypothetical protein
MIKFVTLITAINRLPWERFPAQEERRVSATIGSTVPLHQSISLAGNGDPALDSQYDGPGLTHSDIGTVPDKRSPGLLSAEGVALARGFWLVVLLLFSLVLWAGLGWMVLRHLK